MISTLGGLDGLFLHLETPTMPMHVGSLHVYRLPPGFHGDFTARVRRHLAERLHLSPVFTRRLAPTPLRLSNPAWVDSDEVDLDYHVRHVRLPPPGDFAALERCVARLHAIRMDRSRPLWEFYLIDGLDRPGCVGFYGKVHHAAIDGKAAVALVQAFLDLSPRPRPVPPAPAASQSPAGAAALLKTAAASQLLETRRVLELLPGLLKAGSQVAAAAVARRVRERLDAASDGAGPGSAHTPPLFAPRTPLNVSIGAPRAFAGASVPLRRIKAITATLGGTVNDVVLMLCSGALRRYLDARGALPDEPLIAAVPVSLRAPGDTVENTQATMVRMPLATDIDDPAQRYAAISRASASVKDTIGRFRSLIPPGFPTIGMPWLLPPLASLYGRARIAERLPLPANLVISNVPGPREPLYLAGARMLSYYPASIVTHGLALNITVESYVDDMFFGLTACRRAVPDVDALAAAIGAAEHELTALCRRMARAQAG